MIKNKPLIKNALLMALALMENKEMAPIAINQALGLTHWNKAAWIKLNGFFRCFLRVSLVEKAIIQAKYKK